MLSQHSPESHFDEELEYLSGSEEEVEGIEQQYGRDNRADDGGLDGDLQRLSVSMAMQLDHERDAPASTEVVGLPATATAPTSNHRTPKGQAPSPRSDEAGPSRIFASRSLSAVTDSPSTPRSLRVVSSHPVEISDSESDLESEIEDSESEDYDDDERVEPSPSSFDTRSTTLREASLPTPREHASSSAQEKPTTLGRAHTVPAIGASTPNVSISTPKRGQSDQLPASLSMDSSAPTGHPLALSSNGYAIISHDGTVQDLIEKFGISWGSQYELARGVSKGWWGWSAVTREKLKLLQDLKDAKVPAASKVVDIMLGREIVSRRLDLWRELEREQHALVENRSRGLGLMGGWEGSTQQDWYGGKIQQIVRLVPHQEKSQKGTLPTFYMQLEPMRMGRSYRFARYLGSRRLLQMKLPKLWNVDSEQLKKLFCQKFVLCGRVFVAFAVKDGKVCFVEIDEDYGRSPSLPLGDNLRMSLEAFVEWYNPMGLNGKQKINKWIARFDLGLSTSVPVLEFKAANMFIIKDQCAPHPSNESVPSHKIFTDGCGFMNKTALIAISRAMGYTERSTAVQGRIMGSKGVWTLHPDHTSVDEPPMIWIRHSQQKIHLVDPKDFNEGALSKLDRAHFIFDLLAPSRVSFPSRLSRSTVINLSFNDVPTDAFVKLMKDGLTNEIQALTQWNGPGALPLLWDAVNKASGVTTQRLQRTVAGFQRALGLTNKRDDDDNDDAGLAGEEASTADSTTDMSPPSIGEAIMDRLQAGFTPLQDPCLFDDLTRLVHETMKQFIHEFHIVIPQSAEAFLIPDPTGKLKAGEIHFKSTQYLRDPLQHFNPNHITGDALIFRNPARVASDVQKVKAVIIPELADYVDVIVVPVEGAESLPSLLAGGDVDGDTAVCIFDETLVAQFRQPETVREPSDLMTNFEPLDKVPNVASVLKQMRQYPGSTERVKILHGHLLTGMSESKIGLYSTYHDNAVYQLGYNHPTAIRNAFMFTTILDSRKSGLVLKQDVFKSDKKQSYGRFAPPPCLRPSGGGPPKADQIKRIEKGPFILEELLKAGKKIEEELFTEYHTRVKSPTWGADEDLKQPWLNACKVKFLSQELALLKAHVDDCANQWKDVFQGGRAEHDEKDTVIAKRKATMRKKLELARRFARGPEGCEMMQLMGNIELIRASYAYIAKPKFASAMAFRALCAIKASAKNSKPFTAEFTEVISMASAARRVLSQGTLAVE